MNGDELRTLRKEAGFRAYELAETLGYSRQHWSAFERGHAPVPPVVEYASRWVCEGKMLGRSQSAAELAIQALMMAMERDRLCPEE